MEISLGTLKYKGEELVAFLEPRVGVKPSLSGDSVSIEDDKVREGVRPRHVKTYVKRFLFMNGVRKNYRVFVAGGKLTIQELELGEEEEEEKKEEGKGEEEAKKEGQPEVKEEEGPAPPKEQPEPEEAPAAAPKKERKSPARKTKPRKKEES